MYAHIYLTSPILAKIIIENKIDSSLLAVSASVLAGKEFQLEEREDKDSENTLVFLNVDGSVTLHETDGPQFTASSGTWMIVDDEANPFRLRLDRTFTGGLDRVNPTDIGEFDYTVSREFWGSVQVLAGDIAVIEGVIHLMDGKDSSTIANHEVGYFAMLDSTSKTN